MRPAMFGFAAVVLLCGAVAAPQSGRSDPDEERKRQEKEQEKENERNKDPWRRDGNIPSVLRVQGKVLMAGAGSPPTRVPVRMSCGGGARATLTDPEGNFGFSWTYTTAPGNMPPGQSIGTLPAGCVLEAALAGFRSDAVQVETFGGGSRRYLLVLHPIERIQGYTFSGTTAMAPKSAQDALARGEQALEKGRAPAAEKELRKAVELYPKFAVAWYTLGRALAAQGKNEDARRAFEESAKADPKYINPYPQLLQYAVKEQRWEDVAAHSGRIIGLNPFYSADVYLFSAVANVQLKRWDVAEKHAREAVGLDPEHRIPKVHHTLGHILAERGATQEAAEQLRLYLRYAPSAGDAGLVRERLAEIEARLAAAGK